MTGPFDTIFAPITAPGRAAIAVVRLSGPEALAIARQVFDGIPARPESHRAYFGNFGTGDDGLCLYFAEGRGYTGDESVEFMIHGSAASLRMLLQALEKTGARRAEPGEFSRRAFLNGRLDLTQAEAVRDTVDAETTGQFQAASRVRRGELHARVATICDPIKDVLVAIEASTDFSEEIGPFDMASALQKLDAAERELTDLGSTAQLGRLSRAGAVIALVGPPNAGKSSLLNALVGHDRALVTPIAGTTRDTIEEVVDIHGLACRLIDTAGLRETSDLVEGLGIDRSREAAQSADLTLFIVDSTAGVSATDQVEFDRIVGPKLLVNNKGDLSGLAGAVSATTGSGLRALKKTIHERILGTAVVGELAINARHQPLVEQALAGVRLSADCLRQDHPIDLASVGLRDALQALEQITGITVSDDILDRIFHDFCIGK